MEPLLNHHVVGGMNQSTASLTAYPIPIEKVKNGYDYIIRGGIDYSKLGFKHKTMMGMLYKKAVTLPEEKKTAEVKAMIETYSKQVDFVDLSSLDPIIRECIE